MNILSPQPNQDVQRSSSPSVLLMQWAASTQALLSLLYGNQPSPTKIGRKGILLCLINLVAHYHQRFLALSKHSTEIIYLTLMKLLAVDESTHVAHYASVSGHLTFLFFATMTSYLLQDIQMVSSMEHNHFKEMLIENILYQMTVLRAINIMTCWTHP